MTCSRGDLKRIQVYRVYEHHIIYDVQQR